MEVDSLESVEEENHMCSDYWLAFVCETDFVGLSCLPLLNKEALSFSRLHLQLVGASNCSSDSRDWPPSSS